MHEISILAFIVNVNALLQVNLLRRTNDTMKKKWNLRVPKKKNPIDRYIV